jgi:hypothetical protein
MSDVMKKKNQLVKLKEYKFAFTQHDLFSLHAMSTVSMSFFYDGIVVDTVVFGFFSFFSCVQLKDLYKIVQQRKKKRGNLNKKGLNYIFSTNSNITNNTIENK